MKKIILLFLCLTVILCLSACTYNPPEGYTKAHHTYEEISEFAKSIDPNATVSTEYTDTTMEDWNRNFREYCAVIHGTECHVSSVGANVWNDGFLAGEFARQYYVIDTDYDYLMLQQIVSKKQPDWNMSGSDLAAKYNQNNLLGIQIATNDTEPFTDDELNMIWQQALEIHSEYNKLSVRKSVFFSVPAPAKYYNHHGEGEFFVKRNAFVSFDSFSESDRIAFINKYHEAWALLDSDLPVYD